MNSLADIFILNDCGDDSIAQKSLRTWQKLNVRIHSKKDNAQRSNIGIFAE